LQIGLHFTISHILNGVANQKNPHPKAKFIIGELNSTLEPARLRCR